MPDTQEQEKQKLLKQIAEFQKRQFLRKYCLEFEECEKLAADFVFFAEEKRDDILAKYETLLSNINSFYEDAKKIDDWKGCTGAYNLRDKKSYLRNAIESTHSNLVKDIEYQYKKVADLFSRESLVEATLADSFVVDYLYGLVEKAALLHEFDESEDKIHSVEKLFRTYTSNMRDYLDKNAMAKMRRAFLAEVENFNDIYDEKEYDVDKFEYLCIQYADLHKNKSNAQIEAESSIHQEMIY